MNKKIKKTEQEDFIDLALIFKFFFKEKILILSVTIFFGIIGYYYSKTLTPQHYSTIKLQSMSAVSSPIFNYIRNFNMNLKSNISGSQKEFSHELIRAILSRKNFENFVKKNNSAKTLRSYLDQNKITYLNYLQGDYVVSKISFTNFNFDIDILLSDFQIFYPVGVDGHLILEEYIFSTSKNVFLYFLTNIETQLKQTLNSKKNALNAAQSINLINPKYLSNFQFDYLKGTRVLIEEIKTLNSELKDIQTSKYTLINSKNTESIIFKTPLFEVDWTPITEKPFIKTIPIHKGRTIFFGIMVGLFSAIIFVCAKNYYLIKSKD
jgi:hypothetical protein